MHISYNSIQLTEFVKKLSYSADVINAYVPKDPTETNIINDIKKLAQCNDIRKACDTIIYASADFKRKFDYMPVADGMAYFRGDMPTFDEVKLSKFVRTIKEAQKKQAKPTKTR